MKYCSDCKVKIDGERNHCPLCFREVKEIDNEKTLDYPFAERKKDEKYQKNNTFVFKLFVFMSICVVSICLFVNYYLINEHQIFSKWWSLVVLSSVIYVWVLIGHTIISRRSVFEKILAQLLAIVFLLWTCEFISPNKTWLVNYVFPSISISTVLSLLMITFIRKDKSWLLSFVVITIILTVGSILSFIYLEDKHVLNIINLAISGITLLGYFTFGYQAIKQEFARKFHL